MHEGPGTARAGGHYADLTLVDGGVFVRVMRSAAKATAASAGSYAAAAALPQTLARRTRDIERIELHAPHLDLTVSAIERPPWARAIGRDARGLFAEVIRLGRCCRLDWLPPEAGQPGRWRSEEGLGVDAHGLFVEISVGGASHHFCWILSGRFLMGSPTDEPERFDHEVQHEVTLSRGFWLAETTCPQAFWQAVTGNNLSPFKDDPRNPVEQVSWNDVQAFIGELKHRLPGLPVRLPTDAEWEYACRAGTTTPFSFGDNITPELMEPQVDPQGPQAGDYRVLRGGSWSLYGRHVRSAYRYRNEPGIRARLTILVNRWKWAEQ